MNFVVSNLNNSGTGSLRAAITAASSYSCGTGTAIVDATNVTGTINWGSLESFSADHKIKIMGPRSNQLIIDGGADGKGILSCSGDGDVELDGLKIVNVSGQYAIFKRANRDMIINYCTFENMKDNYAL